MGALLRGGRRYGRLDILHGAEAKNDYKAEKLRR